MINDLKDLACIYATGYVAMVEALQVRGVPVAVAREEARRVMIAILFMQDGEDRARKVPDGGEEVCPLCQRPQP